MFYLVTFRGITFFHCSSPNIAFGGCSLFALQNIYLLLTEFCGHLLHSGTFKLHVHAHVNFVSVFRQLLYLALCVERTVGSGAMEGLIESRACVLFVHGALSWLSCMCLS